MKHNLPQRDTCSLELKSMKIISYGDAINYFFHRTGILFFLPEKKS